MGISSEEVDLPAGSDLRAALDHYQALHPRLGEAARSIAIARNREFASPGTPVSEGDEIAFLPPVSGGLSPDPLEILDAGNYFALTRQAIAIQTIASRMLTGAEGAVAIFAGTVRNHTGGRRTLCLDYECYEPMALQTLARLGGELSRDFALTGVALVHRLGRLLVGETSVAVIATSPHRRAALDAASAGIDRLKKRVPIWKKEHFADGEVWVEGEWDRDVPVAG